MRLGFKYSWSEMAILQDNWENLARQLDGTFSTLKVRSVANTSDSTRKFKLTIPTDGDQITILSTEFNPLKLNCTFNFNSDNEFLIYPEDFTDKISKFFGYKEIQLDDPEFDKAFMIRSKNLEFVRKLLSIRMRRFLLENYVTNFKYENQKNNSILELNVTIDELDNNKMLQAINIFNECTLILKYNLP